MKLNDKTKNNLISSLKHIFDGLEHTPFGKRVSEVDKIYLENCFRYYQHTKSDIDRAEYSIQILNIAREYLEKAKQLVSEKDDNPDIQDAKRKINILEAEYNQMAIEDNAAVGIQLSTDLKIIQKTQEMILNKLGDLSIQLKEVKSELGTKASNDELKKIEVCVLGITKAVESLTTVTKPKTNQSLFSFAR